MRKPILLAAVLTAMTFFACSSDDDSGSKSLADCVTCSVSAGGQTVTDEYCEEDFESRDQYEDFVNAIEASGGDCD